MDQPRWIDAAQVRRAVSRDRARRLIRQALADGFDPASDPARLSPVVDAGQLLVMPSAMPRAVGVKVLSIAPGNPSVGRDLIQAIYVLMDAETLTPSLLMDGTALTSLRTPAVSAVAMDSLAPQEVSSVVVFGSGRQAIGHAEAVLEIRHPSQITFVARDAAGARTAAQRVSGLGTQAAGLSVSEDGVEAAVRAAGIIIAATTSGSPVFDGSWVADGACVVAMGAHVADRRELDGPLLGRSRVVVEDRETARREAGDVVLAIEEGHLELADVATLAELVNGAVTRATDRPNVFKSVGMSWEDLVIADGVARGGRS